MNGREARPRGGVGGIELDRAPEQPRALLQVGLRVERNELPGPEVGLVGVDPRLGPHERPLLAVGQGAAPQRGGHALRDLVLDGEDVAERAVEALRPPVVAGRDLDELDGHPQPVSRLADAALEQRAHAEVTAHGADVGPRPAELEGRGPGGHAEPLDLGEGVDQLLREALAKVVLVPPGAHVRKREDRDGRDVGDGRGRLGRRLGGRLGEGGHEPVAAAMPRLDEARPLRVVPERPAQLLDARGERVVAHRGARPDRLEQVLLGHQLARARDQDLQHCGGLRGEAELLAAGPEASGVELEPVRAEFDAGHWVFRPFSRLRRTGARAGITPDGPGPSESRRNPGALPGLAAGPTSTLGDVVVLDGFREGDRPCRDASRSSPTAS